jgi:hypothetical protein
VQQNQKEVPQREEIKEEEDNLNIFYNHVITEKNKIQENAKGPYERSFT